jgi:hypothetical protein
MKRFAVMFFVCAMALGCSATQRAAVEDARSAACHMTRRACSMLVGACDASEPDAGVPAE